MLVTKFEQNKTARRLRDAEVAYEAYFGKSKTLVECEKYLQVIVNKIKQCNEASLTFLNINESKENILLQRALEKEFGFERMHILWENTSEPDMYTIPAGMFTAVPGTDIEYRKTKGYYDKYHEYECIVVIVMNLIRICDLNAREALACILHEIGHNFDICGCTKTYKIIRIVVLSWFGELQTFFSRQMTKIRGWVQNNAPLITRALSISQDILYNITFTPLDVRIIKKWITSPFDMLFGLLDVQGEHFADSLSAKYGYGPDLASALNKIEDPKKYNGFIKRNLYKVPVVKTLYDIIDASVNTIVGLTAPHPYTQNRIIAIRKNLEMDLNDKNTHPSLKPEIRRQIETLKALENDRINAIIRDQRFVTALRDSALSALDLPQHELMKAD